MPLTFHQPYSNLLSTKIWRYCPPGLKDNLQNVNNSKTQAFSVGACKYEYELNMNDTSIEMNNDIRILGVTLDSNLNFKNHISEQLKKAYAKASALRRIRRFLPTEN